MTVKRRMFLAMAALALFLIGCPAAADDNDSEGNGKAAVYINTWGSWKAKNIKGEYLSDLILAFALINGSTYSSIYMNGFSGLWDEVAELKETWPDLKVTLSVGGANEQGFPRMTADAEKRAAFIADVCAWMKNRDLDGVDIDWEFPGSGQRAAYITLLRETRDALDKLKGETGKQYGLSTAVSAGYNASMLQAAKIADSLKVMNYDYYGSWSGSTGHNANLYNNPRRTGDQSTDKSISAYLNAGIPPEKIMLGVAFYGKTWRGVPKGNYEPGLFQPCKAYVSDQSWTLIKSYLKDGSGYTRYWDAAAQAPFLYNGDRWVTYSDEEQMRRLAGYAKEKKLGGIFAWEYSQDAGAELLKVLAANWR